MSAKSRRERERTALREAILTAARTIAVESGWAAVTIRKIADRVEYSPPIVYEYFDDKEALLLALMLGGFRQLHTRLKEARAANPDPDAALFALTSAYLEFAYENPELYQVMNGLDGISIHVSKVEKPEEIHAVIAEVMDALGTWANAHNVHFPNLYDPFYLLWGALHGLVALHMSGRVSSYSEIDEKHYLELLAQSGLQTLLHGWLHQ